jgi:hypothetical protein
MTRIALGFLLFAAQLSAQAASPGTPRVTCAADVFDFGSVPQHQEIKHAFVIKNDGSAPLEIRNVLPSCSCAAGLPEKKLLQPGEETRIDVVLKTLTFKGPLSKGVSVVTNDPVRPQLSLTMKGDVLPPFYVEPSALQFGKFSKSDPSEPLDFMVVVTAGTPAHITSVNVSNDRITVEPKGEPEKREDGSTAYHYAARVRAGADVGLLRESVIVESDFKEMKSLAVPVVADVAGEVQLSERNLNFGSCSAGETKSKELVITKTGEGNLVIEGVAVVPPGAFKTEVIPVEEGRKYRIRVSLLPDGPAGYHKGSVEIRTNCPGESLIKAWFHAFVKKA